MYEMVYIFSNTVLVGLHLHVLVGMHSSFHSGIKYFNGKNLWHLLILNFFK